MTTTATPPATQPRHPIRVVAQRTGLTPATLRAWERRYQVVEPYRSEGGQRLYSDRDVERLLRLRLLSEGGRAISSVATLDDRAAEALLREDREGRRAAHESGAGDAEEVPAVVAQGVARVVDAAFRRTLALDGEGLEMSLRRAAVTLGAHTFLEDVVAPLLHQVGTAWTRNEVGPAHEHLCTVVVERVLTWLTEPGAAEAGAPRLVVATLPGERHGLGARLVAAAAALGGWHVTHLGVDLPPADIAQAVRTLGATAVALSLVNADTLPAVGTGLVELRALLPEGTTILLGGAVAPRLEPEGLPAGTLVVTLGGLRQALDRLG